MIILEMKVILRYALAVLIAMGAVAPMTHASTDSGLRVNPLNWWVGMETPLTLMVYGDNLAGATVSVNTEDITVKEVHTAESPNYLFVDLGLGENLKAGKYVFTITKAGAEPMTFDYRFENRRHGSAERVGFGPQDVVYLLMPDRFANGDKSNDSSKLTAEKGDRSNPVGRHGGDLKGIMDHLDYLQDLGVTAIWPTPITLDNEPVYSYHGYACSDFYQIDPRYGSNELYRELVEEAHAHGIKFIQDIVPNHSGTAHWWFNDLPFQDWIHQHDEFTRSNYAMAAHSDPYASEVDLKACVDGWFDTSMPDMNLSNPYCLQYYIQMAIWWVEYADLDGIRVDTFPYTKKEDIAAWTKGILAEYPDLTIVGECWFHTAQHLAYWEGCRKEDGTYKTNADGYTSYLPMVMDFCMTDNMVAFTQNSDLGWDDGIKRIYNSIAMDFAYENPYNLLTFITNHDMERPAVRFGAYKDDEENVAARMKNATTLLLTTRGVPQWYYGDEILMRCDEDKLGKGDTWWRTDFPGGWKGDKVNAFTEKGRNPIQNDVFNHTRTLLQWRKGAEAVWNGKLMHFMPFGDLNNTYVYFRYTEDYKDVVMVIINNGTEPVNVDCARYCEFMEASAAHGHLLVSGTDILTGQSVSVASPVKVDGMSSVVIEF